jgi:xylitol oxidase
MTLIHPTNWAGNYSYRAERAHRPTSFDELREIIACTPRARVVASRHSFSDIGDSSELVTLDGLPADVVVDHAARTVAVPAAMTYADLAVRLRAEGVALHNLASLPQISVGGAIATATHGSGDRAGNLATQVAGLELVTSSGEIMTLTRGDADFEGLVVGLGALGAVTRVTLDVEPVYEVRQRVFEGLSWDVLFEQFDAISASAASVSVFTRWQDDIDQLWLKDRVTDEPEEIVDELFGAAAATADRHPIPGGDPVSCNPQLGRPGPWSDRLPHFRSCCVPSSGEEIQSEYFVKRQHGAAAIGAMLLLGDLIRPVLQVSEIRTVAADELWMSPQYEQDTIGIHFTWKREQEAVEHALVAVEAALAPFAARPHWGKLFLGDATTIASLYERLPDFAALVERFDQRGAFRNQWLEERVLGASA